MRSKAGLVIWVGLFVISQQLYSADNRVGPAPYVGPHSSPAINNSMPRVLPTRRSVGAAMHPQTPHISRSSGVAGYRFRPWQKPAPQAYRQQDRIAVQAARSGYRFRPLPPIQRAVMAQPVRYRPLRIQIPNRYVFRPLKPAARRRPPMPEQRPVAATPTAYPPAARHYAYYPNRPWPNSRNMAGGYPAAPWTNAWRAYPPPSWISPQRRYPYPMAQGVNPLPRYQSGPYRWREPTPMPGYPPRYVWRRPDRAFAPPPPAWHDWRVPSPGYGWVGRTAQRPPLPPARQNRYGTDWYDGRGDDDGAWYRLLLQSSPAVSQSWAPVPITNERAD